MGAGTSSGKSTSATSSAPMTSQMFNSQVNSYAGKALTSADIKQFAKTIQQSAQNGDAITAIENNGYYTIQSKYERRGGAWDYTRTNLGNGEVYDKQRVYDDDVSRAVLTNAHSNDPWAWRYQRK